MHDERGPDEGSHGERGPDERGPDDLTPLLIVDAANVVGSVPDGWWRDRPAAARRLRTALLAVAADGLPAAALERPEVVLVVEGAARRIVDDVDAPPGVRVVAAETSGDELIADMVATEAAARRVVVVTADRALRDRVSRRGASVLGPRSLPYR